MLGQTQRNFKITSLDNGYSMTYFSMQKVYKCMYGMSVISNLPVLRGSLRPQHKFETLDNVISQT